MRLALNCVTFVLTFHLDSQLETDIDQLTRILWLCGKPEEEFLAKVSSDEVSSKPFLLFVCLFVEQNTIVVIISSVLSISFVFSFNSTHSNVLACPGLCSSYL